MNELTNDELNDGLSEFGYEIVKNAEKRKMVNFGDYKNPASRKLFFEQFLDLRRLIGDEALSLMIQKMMYAAKQTNQGESK